MPRKFHLGMWSRTVIVLSAVWMVAGTYIQFQYWERETRSLWMSVQWNCMELAWRHRNDSPPSALNHDYCIQQATEAERRAASYSPEHLKNAALKSLGEVGMGWIAAFLTY